MLSILTNWPKSSGGALKIIMKKSLGSLVILNRRALLSFAVMLSFALSATVSWRIEAQNKSGIDLRSEKKGEINVVPNPQPPSNDRTASPETTGTESEPNDTSVTADLMPAFDPNSIMSGAINPGGDLDFFSFPAPANSRVWVLADTGGTPNPGANSFDSVIDLLATDGSTVIENDDDDGTGNGGDTTVENGVSSVISGAALATGGTYFVRVRGFVPGNVINPYRLFVRVTTGGSTPEVEPNNTTGTANAGGLNSGSIGTAGDVDYFSITAEAGSRVYINVDGDPERDGTGTDLVVTFRDATDTSILNMDSSITGSLANPAGEGGNYTITATGTYYVRVAHFDPAGTGTYDLMVARNLVPTGTACAPAVRSVTNSTPVAISAAGTPVVSSTINVAGAGLYLTSLNVRTSITHTFSSDLDITLTSPAGTIVTLTTDNGGVFDDVFNGTTWSDFANPFGQVPYTANNGLATDHTYVNLVTATPLVPEEGLAAFVGENPNGNWTLTISDDANLDGGSLNTWSLDVFASTGPGVNPLGTFTQAGAVGIPSATTFVASSTISVAGLTGPIEDVNVVTNITHTFAADLDITVQAPSGKTVTLSTDNGGVNDDVFNGTLWDSDANPGGPVPYTSNNGVTTDHTYANLTTATPLTGEESLGAFRGEQPNGTWRITVSDDAVGDGGALGPWELRIVTNTCPLPTAAGVDVAGRVTTAEGNGLRNARVTLADQSGTVLQTAITSAFGFYRFTNVEVGQTYIVSVGSKRYTFTPRVIQVFDSIADADFTALP